MAGGQVISNQVRLYFQRGFTVGAVARIFPYVWSVDERRPKARKGWGNVACYYMNMTLGFAYTAFVIGRCIQKNLDPSVATGMKIYLKGCAIYYTFPTTYHLFIFLKKSELLRLSCHILSFMDLVEQRMDFDSKRLMRRSNLILTYTFYGFIVISLWVFMYAFVAPDSPELISSVLADRSFLTRMLCGLFQGYVEYVFRSQSFLILFVLLNSALIPWVVLSEMRNWVGQLKRPDVMREFVLLYNSIRLVVSMSSTVLLSVIVPAQKCMVIGVVIICVYNAVRLHGFLAMSLSIMGIILGVFVTLLFSTMADVYHLSRVVKSDMKGRGLCHKKKDRIGASLPDIRFWMASTYFADRMLALTIARTIIESSITFLLWNPA